MHCKHFWCKKGSICYTRGVSNTTLWKHERDLNFHKTTLLFKHFKAKNSWRWQLENSYRVEHVFGVGGGDAETRSGLDDGRCWEPYYHHTNVPLQHLPPKCPEDVKGREGNKGCKKNRQRKQKTENRNYYSNSPTI